MEITKLTLVAACSTPTTGTHNVSSIIQTILFSLIDSSCENRIAV